MGDSFDEHLHQQGSRMPYWLGTCVLLGVMGFFLWEEHQAHLLGAIPYVLLLLCPAVHFFMHRGHGGSAAWPVLFKAQQEGTLATSGPYAYVRHPQYVAFVAIMFGFLLQWPTLVTLVMFPILVVTYARLARREERDVRPQFGAAWDDYAERTPAFAPRLGGRRLAAAPRGRMS